MAPVCSKHSDCGEQLQCLAGRCLDPCRSGCGQSAVCTVKAHVPTCTCPPTHTGNPNRKCIPIIPTTTASGEPIDAGTTTTESYGGDGIDRSDVFSTIEPDMDTESDATSRTTTGQPTLPPPVTYAPPEASTLTGDNLLTSTGRKTSAQITETTESAPTTSPSHTSSQLPTSTVDVSSEEYLPTSTKMYQSDISTEVTTEGTTFEVTKKRQETFSEPSTTSGLATDSTVLQTTTDSMTTIKISDETPQKVTTDRFKDITTDTTISSTRSYETSTSQPYRPTASTPFEEFSTSSIEVITDVDLKSESSTTTHSKTEVRTTEIPYSTTDSVITSTTLEQSDTTTSLPSTTSKPTGTLVKQDRKTTELETDVPPTMLTRPTTLPDVLLNRSSTTQSYDEYMGHEEATVKPIKDRKETETVIYDVDLTTTTQPTSDRGPTEPEDDRSIPLSTVSYSDRDDEYDYGSEEVDEREDELPKTSTSAPKSTEFTTETRGGRVTGSTEPSTASTMSIDDASTTLKATTTEDTSTVEISTATQESTTLPGVVTHIYDSATTMAPLVPSQVCLTDANCLQNETCVDGFCIDPCRSANPCPREIPCLTQNHQPKCLCNKADPLDSANCIEESGNIFTESLLVDYPLDRSGLPGIRSAAAGYSRNSFFLSGQLGFMRGPFIRYLNQPHRKSFTTSIGMHHPISIFNQYGGRLIWPQLESVLS